MEAKRGSGGTKCWASMAEQALLAMMAQLAENQGLLTQQVQQHTELLEIERT